MKTAEDHIKALRIRLRLLDGALLPQARCDSHDCLQMWEDERDALIWVLAHWDASRREVADCKHERTSRGANIPLRWGSARSEVCRDCGAFRERDHHGNLRDARWRPASEYAEAIAEQELD